MTEQIKVVFEVATAAAEERLVREYVAPAFSRIDQRDDAQWPMFNRYGTDPSVETGELVFIVFGDTEAVVSDERPRWSDLVDDGVLLDWQTETPGIRIDSLEEQERFRYRLRTAASRMSLEFFEVFDPLPDSLHELDTEEHPIGWELCLHHVINQLGYQENCSEEEVDLLFRGLVSRLYAMAIAPGYGAEFAEGKIEELTTELESLPPELQRLQEEHQP